MIQHRPGEGRNCYITSFTTIVIIVIIMATIVIVISSVIIIMYASPWARGEIGPGGGPKSAQDKGGPSKGGFLNNI